jgi:fibro-slime domain-containing protein
MNRDVTGKGLGPALSAVFLGVCLLSQTIWSQPATITLTAKLRDFRDDAAAAGKHPDFENSAFQACGHGVDPGFVNNAIGTADAANAQFPGDNRGPVLVNLNHPTWGTPCYTSQARFQEWYNDVAGVNRSFYYDLVLTRNPDGTYTYNDDAFFPLDSGEAWRKFNPADPDPFPMRTSVERHNYGFTLEIHTSFTYVAGQGQVFRFRGDDDTWVFINGRLAIDLGGLRSATADSVVLDAEATALGLVNGQSYAMDVYFAERFAYGSHFRISTTLQLGPQPSILPTPVADPPAGAYANSPVNVSLSVPGHPLDSVRIHYTLDGTDPDSNDARFTGPIPVAIPPAGSTTLKAKAYRTGYVASPILTALYSRQPVALPMPVADPPGRNFNPSIIVGLSVPGHADAAIRYTVDGSDPTPQSPLYTGSLTFTQTTTLKARAYKAGWLPSPASNDVYTRDFSTLPMPVATPPGPPPGRSFLYSVDVGLSVPGHPDAAIRYTVDGSDPTLQSPL